MKMGLAAFVAMLTILTGDIALEELDSANYAITEAWWTSADQFELGRGIVTESPYRVGGGIRITTSSSGSNNDERIVRVDVEIIVDNANSNEARDIIMTFAEREAEIGNIIANVLRQTTFEQLAVINGLEVVTDEILIELQEFFGSQLIARIHFVELVVQ